MSAKVDVRPIAWMRRWAFNGETPTKKRNANGRMAWAPRFRFLPVTRNSVFDDDVALVPASAVAELIEAHKESIAEIERLRDAMFRVYTVAANGGDTAPAIELMRDEMDKPCSVDRSRAALSNIGPQS